MKSPKDPSAWLKAHGSDAGRFKNGTENPTPWVMLKTNRTQRPLEEESKRKTCPRRFECTKKKRGGEVLGGGPTRACESLDARGRVTIKQTLQDREGGKRARMKVKKKTLLVKPTKRAIIKLQTPQGKMVVRIGLRETTCRVGLSGFQR